MTFIHCYVDRVKLNIMQRGVLAVSFMVINGKTRYQASKSWKAINLRESWKSKRGISHINKRQWKSKTLLFIAFWYIPESMQNFQKIFYTSVQSRSVQSLSHFWLFLNPWTAAHQDSLSITDCWSFLKLMSIQLVMPSNNVILCHPLLLLPSIFPGLRGFSNESAICIRWPKYWSFSISPSNEHTGLISFRMDWLDLLAC